MEGKFYVGSDANFSLPPLRHVVRVRARVRVRVRVGVRGRGRG